MLNADGRVIPVRSIVKDGLTAEQRLAVARRDEAVMETLRQCFDRAVLDQICVLCDEFAAKQARRAA